MYEKYISSEPEIIGEYERDESNIFSEGEDDFEQEITDDGKMMLKFLQTLFNLHILFYYCLF